MEEIGLPIAEPDFEMDMRWFIDKLVKAKTYQQTIRIRKQINMMLDAYQKTKVTL